MISAIREIIQRRKKIAIEDIKFISNITLDNNASEIQDKLKLTKYDITRIFFFVFRKVEGKKSYLSIDTIFRKFVKEEVSPFGIMVFELFVEDVDKIEYCELVYAICSFCLFELEEMVKLMWYKEDPEKVGHLLKSDVEDFMMILHGEGVKKRNVKTALGALRFKRDGSTTFRECCAWCKIYPCILEPAFRIQAKLRETFLGMSFWERKVVAERKDRRSQSGVSVFDTVNE